MDVEADLKQKILNEMTANYSNILEKNFELAKRFIRITQGGTVDVLVKDKVPGKEKILLYLIGKIYAKEAGLSSVEYATNKELSNELGIGMGSVLPWLKELRDNHKIKAIKNGVHVISISVVENVLMGMSKRLNKK
jgi:hypothetical protein